MPGGTLFRDTMKQYYDYTIREALHNCILCKQLHYVTFCNFFAKCVLTIKNIR